MEDSLQQMPGSNMDEQRNTFDQGLNNPVTEAPAKQDTQAAGGTEELRIPVAVYTATVGHGWSKLPKDFGRDDARDLWKKIRRKVKEIVGDNLLGEIAYGDKLEGVLYEGDEYAYAFKLQKVENWDQSSRGADYCACAFVSNKYFSRVGFQKLLEDTYFTEPRHTPASEIVFVDEGLCAPTQNDVANHLQDLCERHARCESIDFDWNLIGPILCQYGDKNPKWFFSRMISHEKVKPLNDFGEWHPSLFEEPSNEREETISHGNFKDEFISSSKQSQQALEPKVVTDVSTQVQAVEIQLRQERINKQTEAENHDLRERVEELKRCLSAQKSGYRFLENESFRKDAKIREISQKNMLHCAVAFLFGILMAGIVFLCVQLVLSNGGDRSERPGYSSWTNDGGVGE